MTLLGGAGMSRPFPKDMKEEWPRVRGGANTGKDELLCTGANFSFAVVTSDFWRSGGGVDGTVNCSVGAQTVDCLMLATLSYTMSFKGFSPCNNLADKPNV